MQPNEIDRAVYTIEPPFELRRRGVEEKNIVGDTESQPDCTLLRALSRAHVWAADLRNC